MVVPPAFPPKASKKRQRQVFRLVALMAAFPPRLRRDSGTKGAKNFYYDLRLRGQLLIFTGFP